VTGPSRNWEKFWLRQRYSQGSVFPCTGRGTISCHRDFSPTPEKIVQWLNQVTLHTERCLAVRILRKMNGNLLKTSYSTMLQCAKHDSFWWFGQYALFVEWRTVQKAL
jgi:hypothetical protein